MKVVREKPSQRRHHRVNAPMKVILDDGSVLTATDWSLGGLRLDGYPLELPANKVKQTLTLQVPFQGFDISFEVDAYVVRVIKESHGVCYEFGELSERARDLLNHFIDDLVRGNMASVDDTICRIDVPVTPISTKPDPNPASDAPVNRLPVKTIVMTAFYSILGLLTFGYLGVLMYSNTMRMEVRSAVVSAPLATIKMPIDGIIRPVRFEMGASVEQGQEIARIENARFESDLTEKRIELDAALRDQRRAQQKYRIEENRMKLYQVISRTDRQIAEAKVTSAREALEAADTAYERLAKLYKKKLVTANKLELATKERAQAESRLKDAEYELERTTAMDSVSGRKHFNHKEFVADLDVFALEIEEANSRVKTIHMQLEKLERQRTAMSILAPYDGKIVSLQQAAHTNVLRNAPLLTIEQRVEPTVTAFLDQEQVLNVGLNDEAKVFLPSLGQHIEAKVTMIDRNSTFINSDRSHYSWKDGREKSAAVSLRLNLSAIPRDEISAGLPAVVVFSKRQTNDIYHSISSVLTWSGREQFDGQSI
ncbi:MAG: HlyD family efflux transporter periplasmic adaptor subunit [Ahrensia sp.]|nr:HlyD family efflux transporter periplasmic adaptor subunit [Ahrensia sp.]